MSPKFHLFVFYVNQGNKEDGTAIGIASGVEIRARSWKLLVRFINLPARNLQETSDSRTLYFKLFTNICIITILSFLY